MTDEDGVEEKYQPTTENMVRHFSPSRRMLTHLIHVSPQKREIRALSHGVRPGDRRVFYCMSLLPSHSVALILPQPSVAGRSDYTPNTTDSEGSVDGGSALVALHGHRIRNIVRSSRPIHCGIQIWILPFRHLGGGW